MTEQQVIYGRFLSRCCRARQVIVRSRDGGFVTQGCEQCGKARPIRFDELPDLSCPICLATMKAEFFNKNYSYRCKTCPRIFQLYMHVPWWNEWFAYDGVATPNERNA